LLADRKVCGILIETSADFAVLGIGLNVNGSFAESAELGGRATTLAQTLGYEIAREAVAAALLWRLDAFYAQLQTGGEGAQAALRAAWRDRLSTLGQRVMVRQGGQALAGVAEEVDPGGALLLRTPDGALRAITWGDIE
jgi:BirA family biotin operon repressor/biotin-[acetyl-CoA-carboxylase] ligase